MRKKVILDMDPGIDDAIAIALALQSPELELLGITTVAGNTYVDKAARNALRVLNYLGRKDIPVYLGSEHPLVRDLKVATLIHGFDGLGDCNIPHTTIKPKDGAIDFILKCCEEEKGKITIVATGPLTNIAKLILTDNTVVRKLNEIVIMGGAYCLTKYGFGNVTPVSEFNMYTDPEAAKIVFESGIKPLCVGLDVTTDPRNVLREEHIERLSKSTSRTASLVVRVSKRLFGMLGFLALHDPIALALSIKDIARTEEHYVYICTSNGISRGQTVVERREWLKSVLPLVEKFARRAKESPYVGFFPKTFSKVNARICVDIDSNEFLNLIMNRLC